MTTTVPTSNSLSGVGSVSLSSRCARTPSSFSSVDSAASAAASDIERPTVSGVMPDGKITVFLSGSMGSSKTLFCVIRLYPWIGASCRRGKVLANRQCAPFHSHTVQMQNEPAVSTFASNLGTRKIAGDFQNALETAVGYLELVIAPAFGYDGIASHPAHYQLVIRYDHLDVVRLDSRKI